MDNYWEKFQTAKDIRTELYKIYNVNSQAQLAKKLNMSESTLSRLFSHEYAGRTGPKCSNVETIVRVITEYSKADVNKIRRRIYELVYPPELVEDNLLVQEVELSKGKMDNNPETVIREKTEATAIIEEADLGDVPEINTGILNEIKEAIFKIAKECNLAIKNYRVSKKNDNAIIVDVIPQYNIIFMGAYIGMIYGMYLSEENYFSLIHDVAELNTEDGIIILFYTDEKVFNKAWNEELFKVKNNVLLYCLSKDRKIYVKSVRKKQKAFLKNILGEDRLMF